MPNRLINETSPYLLQHAHNPVDWYPWGPEALQRAKDEDKPILLSIGYSACHWCHVMEHESFENEAIAGLMNTHFVCIKVDREERPDLDSIYMEAVMALTGSGGWPMTTFLTPEGAPFYGGTYFPPVDRHGLPGFPRVLQALSSMWQNQREDMLENAAKLRDHLTQQSDAETGDAPPTRDLLDRSYARLASYVDTVNGGFGNAPKFPSPMNVEFMLRSHLRMHLPQALDLVEKTLEKMARGGIYDQIGGGFARYSTDAHWLVPHFEKMLYDNSQLSALYLHAYQATGKPTYRRVAEETLDYVQTEMTGSSGGFYSTQDADSEGVEGKYYVWTQQEINDVLGTDDGRVVNLYFGTSAHGNFEGQNILYLPRDIDVVAYEAKLTVEQVQEIVARSRPKLYAARDRRIHPGRDEKILTAWNGMMLRAFAEAARVLGRDDYRQTAINNAEFLLRDLRRDGLLLRTHKDGRSSLNAYLEDYGALIDGLLALYETTFDPRWFTEAVTLTDTMLEQFWDATAQVFYDTGINHEQLIKRPHDVFDNAMPSGTSLVIGALVRLATFTGEQRYEDIALTVFKKMRGSIQQMPSSFGHLLNALDFYLAPPKEIALVGDPTAADTHALLAVLNTGYTPNRVVALSHPDPTPDEARIPLLVDRPQRNNHATAYVCQNMTCQQPVTTPEELAAQLGK